MFAVLLRLTQGQLLQPGILGSVFLLSSWHFGQRPSVAFPPPLGRSFYVFPSAVMAAGKNDVDFPTYRLPEKALLHVFSKASYEHLELPTACRP